MIAGGHVKLGAPKNCLIFLTILLPLVEGGFMGSLFQTEVVYMGFPTMLISNMWSEKYDFCPEPKIITGISLNL